MKRRERVSSFLIVEAGLILLNILCYGDIRWLLLEQILLFPCFNVLKRKKREKEKHLYEKGFQNLLQSMMTSLQAGYSLNNSCRIALKELEELYQDQNNPMLRQMRRIIQGLDLHITLEQLFMEFAESTGLEEAKQFAVVIEIVRSTGGNMVEILKRTMQHEEVNQETKEETNKKDTESDLKGDVDKNTDNVEDMKPDEKAASEEIEPVSEETLKERNNWKEIKGTLQLLMRTGILFYAAEHPESLSRQSIPGTNLPSKRVKGSSFDNEQRLLDKMDELSFSSLKGIKSLLSVDISMDGRGTLWTKDRYIISYIEDCFSFYGGSDKKDNALLYEVEYLISGKNSDIDNLKRVANYILLLRFINNYIFTGKDTQMKTHINTMASAITGVMGMPQTMKAVQVLIRMAISYGESLLELHTLFSGGEVPLIKDKTTWNLTLKTMAEQLRNKQIVKKGKKNISYKDYLKLFLLTKGNSRTVCYRMMDIMQENIASKEPGFLMENCLFSYSWKGSLAAGGVKLNFVKQCSY